MQLGLNIHVTRQGAVGPFFAYTLGKYSHDRFAQVTPMSTDAIAQDIASPQTHNWILFGIQGSYFDNL